MFIIFNIVVLKREDKTDLNKWDHFILNRLGTKDNSTIMGIGWVVDFFWKGGEPRGAIMWNVFKKRNTEKWYILEKSINGFM